MMPFQGKPKLRPKLNPKLNSKPRPELARQKAKSAGAAQVKYPERKDTSPPFGPRVSGPKWSSPPARPKSNTPNAKTRGDFEQLFESGCPVPNGQDAAVQVECIKDQRTPMTCHPLFEGGCPVPNGQVRRRGPSQIPRT